MKKTAVFPGSFDPFTLGHLDILHSALKLFDEVVIAVGNNANKRSFFSLQARLDLIREATRDLPQVRALAYDGLTINFCKALGIHYMIRGLRSTTDFEYEQAVAHVNQYIDPDILTVFIPSSTTTAHISSTIVKDIFLNGGNIKGLMPEQIDLAPYVAQSREG